MLFLFFFSVIYELMLDVECHFIELLLGQWYLGKQEWKQQDTGIQRKKKSLPDKRVGYTALYC